MFSEKAVKISGLKCDVCDYKDDSINVENYFDYINFPCPKCGQPLLTKADYDNVQLLLKVEKKIQSSLILRFLNWLFRKRHYKIKMNGTGKMEIKRIL